MSDQESTRRLLCLMFTDLVDSAALKRDLGDAAYVDHVARPHNAIFRDILAGFAGADERNYTGDGFLATFDSVADAVNAALLFHHALASHEWQAVRPQTRVGIHLGDTTIFPGADESQQLLASHAADMCARLMSLGQGGQTLLTRAAFDSARQYVRHHPADPDGPEPPQLEWLAHGRYIFKGSDEPFEVFEVGAPGAAPLAAPPNTEKARRAVSEEEQRTLGWRPAPALTIPRRDSWVLEEKLGEGGFGEVWLARHQRTKQQRVFKFCFDPQRLRSFKRELTLFRLIRAGLGQRDDIVPLLDVQVEEPPYFLESEYIAGGNLRQWAARQGGLKSIPLGTRLELLIRIARAVAAAHSLGIIHKDIKPSNVFIDEGSGGTPQPRLSDFGIGLLSDSSLLAEHLITETGFTDSLIAGNDSSRTGTRLYAPPESQIGKPATTAGDVYALGVFLYQLIVGDLTRPLGVGWEHDVADELLREDIAACVHRDPQARLSSASLLADRLQRLPERRERVAADRAAAAARERSREVVKVGLRTAFFSMFVVWITASVIGYWVYDTAFDKVIQRERVHLRDATALRGREIIATIATLRTDVLSLTAEPGLEAIVRARGEPPNNAGEFVDPQTGKTVDQLRRELAEAFRGLCLDEQTDGSLQAKPYYRVRLIEFDDPPRELVRVQRVNGTSPPEFADVDPSPLNSEDPFVMALREESRQRRIPERDVVRLSEFELDRERDFESGDDRLQPTIRAAVVVRGLGVLVIDLDVTEVFDDLLESAGQLTFLTDESGNFLVHPDQRLEFAWQKQQIDELAGDYNGPREMFALQREHLLWPELMRFYGENVDDADVSPATYGYNLIGDGFGLLRLEYPFRLKHFRFTRGWDDAAFKRLTDKLASLCGELGDRVIIPGPDRVIPGATTILSVSASLDNVDALAALSEVEMELLSIPGMELQQTADCRQFYASFVRINYDPQDPDRFLGLVMAVSQDEMYADLFDTRIVATAGSCCIVAPIAPLAFVFSYLFVNLPFAGFRRRSRRQVVPAAGGQSTAQNDLNGVNAADL